MKKAEFDECTSRIGWSLLQTAKRLNIPENTLRRLVERGELPRAAAVYLRTVAGVVAAVPVPEL